jgi:uncharacterized protein YwgA
MHQYRSGLLDPFVTLLEVHKLMYFQQIAGEPLRLRFKKGHYGPYAENLRHVLNALEGHMISGYADGGDAPHKRLELLPGVLEKAHDCLVRQERTRQNFTRVCDLVEGFESPFGLELLSTVHWIVEEEKARSLDEVMTKTYAWGPQKKKFTPRQIGLALERLEHQGWTQVHASS